MNCKSAQELVSAFYDWELKPDTGAAVHEHVQSCADCARRLAEFEDLSKLAADLQQPAVPAGVWSAISTSLDAQSHRGPGRTATNWLRKFSRAAIAAVLLLGFSTTLFVHWTRNATDDHSKMAATFGHYLTELDQNPERAQRLLLARYEGQLVDLQGAASEVKFDPNAPERLPDGFSRSTIYVLKMPCCTCTQTIYWNAAGDTLAIFEHAAEQQDWFGDRPTIVAKCHGRRAFLVQLHDRLAATWRVGPRYLTVVGARNVEQVAELVAFLDHQGQALANDKGAT